VLFSKIPEIVGEKAFCELTFYTKINFSLSAKKKNLTKPWLKITNLNAQHILIDTDSVTQTTT